MVALGHKVLYIAEVVLLLDSDKPLVRTVYKVTLGPLSPEIVHRKLPLNRER